MLLEVDQLVLPLDLLPGNRTPSLTLNLIRLNMIWEAIIQSLIDYDVRTRCFCYVFFITFFSNWMSHLKSSCDSSNENTRKYRECHIWNIQMQRSFVTSQIYLLLAGCECPWILPTQPAQLKKRIINKIWVCPKYSNLPNLKNNQQNLSLLRNIKFHTMPHFPLLLNKFGLYSIQCIPRLIWIV